ncbi:hypothetical protein RRG08_001233 [Elysia crispata]|uniref:Uncharacterized protein n=1 Tax=Elysia crispata TaxID=231223 RepID=A0AAE1EBW2_9GAST|nr:hypothetical protein RRG08_001233 [Elysia crispata]
MCDCLLLPISIGVSDRSGHRTDLQSNTGREKLKYRGDYSFFRVPDQLRQDPDTEGNFSTYHLLAGS